jgi:DNA mismatch endonuclease (patch repair protein)
MRMLKILKEGGLKGWRRHLSLPGKPDFAWKKQRIALFVDGCFWHGCPKCYRQPKSNISFWREKVERNVLRDRKNSRILRALGWTVIRVRECQIKKNRESIKGFVWRVRKLLLSS